MVLSKQRVLNDQLAAAARSFHAEVGKPELLSRAIAIATDIVVGCDFAGVSIIQRKGVIDVPAATNEQVRLLDELQFTLGEGPCIDAIWLGDTVHSADLAGDGRWKSWGPRAVAELGVASMLAFQLFTTAETVGALNLYSQRLDAFDAEDINSGYYLAAHLAVAIAGAETEAQLNTAIVSRASIGRAEGILMERFGLEPAQAFAVLTRVSQQRNMRLNAVAAELVQMRDLPEFDAPQPD